jgi:hypothetical protein
MRGNRLTRAGIQASRYNAESAMKEVRAEKIPSTDRDVPVVDRASREGMRCAMATPDEIANHRANQRRKAFGRGMIMRAKVFRRARQSTIGRKDG